MKTKTALFFMLFAIALFGIIFLLGCGTNQVKESTKKIYTRADFKSDEAWNWFLCKRESQQIQDGVFKDKKGHNVLECQSLENDLVDRKKLDRSIYLYEFCKDKRYEKHTWQQCYDKILVK